MAADARKPPVPTRTGKSLLHIVKQHRTKQRERTMPADPLKGALRVWSCRVSGIYTLPLPCQGLKTVFIRPLSK
jgi:hypothetical protein